MDLGELEAQFAVQGRFRTRSGAGASGPHSNKKLCLAATDKRHLVELLYAYSLRPDCFWVKYTPEPRDSLYLGRVFLADDNAVGVEWARLKDDHKILCSVQDDDFIAAFRTK
jgi:hypothetical protein